jgi:hypothetical protein
MGVQICGGRSRGAGSGAGGLLGLAHLLSVVQNRAPLALIHRPHPVAQSHANCPLQKEIGAPIPGCQLTSLGAYQSVPSSYSGDTP